MLVKKSLAAATFFLLLGTLLSSSTVSSELVYVAGDAELDLLHGEAFFYITANSDVTPLFNVTWAAPPNYENQAPVLIDIRDDTSAEILTCSVINDTNPPNKVLKFLVAPLRKGEQVSIHFDYFVLVKNKWYDDLPDYVKIPAEDELPDDTKTWLVSTEAIQSDNVLIKLKARELRYMSDDLIELGEKIVKYTCSHKTRFILWYLTNLLFPGEKSQWAKYLDAVSSLFFGGSCTGRANLGTALFRANGVPAKNVIVTPVFAGKDFWFDAHYISEYYCPDYGWVSAETTLGVTPYEPKNNIVLRVNYPEDENLAGNGNDYYGGCEPWFWTDNVDVQVWWRPREESGTRGWLEKEVTTNQDMANLLFNLTQTVYELHTKYMGVNLSEENQLHFDKAMLAQKNAVECFNQSDIIGYLNNITLAYTEYKEID
ncbi:MAG TPA: hypothetical protein ENI42_05570 [Thermoplasmatales archaeon]|nr:hypothetical protein [Thermoplasmatales archaeon]